MIQDGAKEGVLISVIVPIINEADRLESFARALQDQLIGCEVIFVDGGSTDGSQGEYDRLGLQWLTHAKGRAVQMNAGAAVAKGRYLLFLHVDTGLPNTVLSHARQWQSENAQWGFFKVRLSGARRIFRVIEWCINQRSIFSRVATGDQAIFVVRELWEVLGGFQSMPLMEDVELTKRLRRASPPLVIRDPVITSSRRWEQNGVFKTILLMWWLRLLFWLGVPPNYLARLYR